MWSLEETGLKKKLKQVQKIWNTILDEALTVLESKDRGFTEYHEEKQSGKWDYFSLFLEGEKNEENCSRMPQTCSVIEKIPEVTGIMNGQVILRFVL